MVVELYTFPFPPQKTSKFLHPEKTKPHFHTPLTPSIVRAVCSFGASCVCVFVVQVVVLLLNARANLEAVDSDGRTALMYSAINGHDKVRGGHTAGREGGSSPHTHNMPLEGGGRGVGRKGG